MVVALMFVLLHLKNSGMWENSLVRIPEFDSPLRAHSPNKVLLVNHSHPPLHPKKVTHVSGLDADCAIRESEVKQLKRPNWNRLCSRV